MIHPDLMTGIMAEVMELVVVDEDEVEEEVEEGEMEVAEAAVDVEDVVEEAVVILVEVTTWDMEETSHKIL